MTSTTYPAFNDKTEATEVVQAFAESVRGKTILVTGVNLGGIGFMTAEALASQSPAHLIVAGRNDSKLQEGISSLRAQFPAVDYRPLKVDLSNQKSVREAAAEVLSWPDVPHLDILVNNAGVMYIPERTLSADGIEMHFATNHIGHFLLTSLLMPKLLAAAKSNPVKGATRIVNVSAAAITISNMRWSDTNFEKKNKDLPEDEKPVYEMHRGWGEIGDLDEMSYLPLEGYVQSKIANVLFGIAANKRLYEKYGILSLALHPAILPTELGRSMGPDTVEAVHKMVEMGVFSFTPKEAAASTSLVAALDPKLKAGETRDGKENYGSFLMDCQISDKAKAGSVSSDNAEKLWKLSEELVKEEFSW